MTDRNNRIADKRVFRQTSGSISVSHSCLQESMMLFAEVIASGDRSGLLQEVANGYLGAAGNGDRCNEGRGSSSIKQSKAGEYSVFASGKCGRGAPSFLPSSHQTH